jgi:hypothetical protein
MAWYLVKHRDNFTFLETGEGAGYLCGAEDLKCIEDMSVLCNIIFLASVR